MNHLFFCLAFPFQSQLFLLTSQFVAKWLPFPCYAKAKGQNQLWGLSFPLPLLSVHGLRFIRSFWESHAWNTLTFFSVSCPTIHITSCPFQWYPTPCLSLSSPDLHCLICLSTFFLSSINCPPHAKTLSLSPTWKKKILAWPLAALQSSCSLMLFSVPTQAAHFLTVAHIHLMCWHFHFWACCWPALHRLFQISPFDKAPSQPLDIFLDCSS